MRPIKHMRNVLIGTTASLIVGAVAPAMALAAPTRPASSAARSAKLSSPGAETKAATDAFAAKVRGLSHPRALESAFHAYYAYKAAHPNEVKKPYLYFVDFGQPATAARGYVFDMNSLTIVDGPFTVAHGSGSGSGIPTRFSNANGSKATSLGLYTTASTYGFSGHNAGRAYTSVGLRLKGQSKGFNDNALARGVVAHGAPYVTASKAGRSQGCPAMEPVRAERLLPMLANGSVVFLFAPDSGWMASDQWIAA